MNRSDPFWENSRRKGQPQAELIRDLVRRIHTDAFQPQYRKFDFGQPVCGWPARLESYFWPDPNMNYEATHRKMEPLFRAAGELSTRLLTEGRWTDPERTSAKNLSWEMLVWGGVTRQSRFSEGTVENVFRKALGLPHQLPAPMNSGWTKVAAMATAFLEGDSEKAPHVIWDSRVSTSLVTRLESILLERNLRDPKQIFPGIGPVPGRGGSRPRQLQLRWAHAYMSWPSQLAGSALVRAIRDELNYAGYPAMPSPLGGSMPWTIRGVESVLFMDGY